MCFIKYTQAAIFGCNNKHHLTNIGIIQNIVMFTQVLIIQIGLTDLLGLFVCLLKYYMTLLSYLLQLLFQLLRSGKAFDVWSKFLKEKPPVLWLKVYFQVPL